MFIRVDLPAPFSPSRAWISPGSTTRSMWALATRSPKRLVMPRSSSLSATSWWGRHPGRPRESGGRDGPGRAYFGCAGEVTCTLPLMMSCLSWSSSLFRSAGTLLSRSWNGASCTPLLASVPVDPPPPCSDPSAALRTASRTASEMFLTTVERNTEQYCWALTQPSWSTQITLYAPLDCWAPAAVPRPVPPATGMITSAFCATNWSDRRLPPFWSVNEPANEPFCAALSQPSTLTFLPLALLYWATPSTKPSMKIVTGGILRPPYVPTTPLLLIPAARYPARKPACAGSNCIEYTFGDALLASTMANFWFGLAVGASVGALPLRPPTPPVRAHFCRT